MMYHKHMENSNDKKILIVALSGIGNYVMQSSTIAAIKAAHPNWHITVWVAPRGTKPLVRNDKNVDEVIEMPIQGSIKDHIQRILQLRKRSFDIGIVLSPGQLIKSDIYLFAAGISERVGHTYPYKSRSNLSLFLNKKVQEDETLHDIEQNLNLADALSISTEQYKNKPYKLSLPDSLVHEGEQIRTVFNIEPETPIIGMHAGSAPDFLWKRWPLDRFAAVAHTLIQQHKAHILLFGGPDEQDQKQELTNLIGANCSVVTAPLLTTATYLKQCNLMISNDSGLMHIAAAVGIPTLGIFGPTDERKTGPRGIKSYIVRAENTQPVYNTEQSYSLGKESHSSILAVTPEMVVKRIEEVFSS